jgi:hypothetical protein
MRALFRNMPWSLSWFALTGVIFLLQLIPFTGIFLMLVAAPLWSIATINLGFLSIGVEVLTRRISPLWLALPVIWFGGYAAVAHVSNQQAAGLDAEIRAANAGQRMTFVASSQALVFDTSLYGLSGAAGEIVRAYRVPVAYQTSTDKRNPVHRASRIALDPLCQDIRSDRSYQAAGINVSWFHAPGGVGSRSLVKGMCSVNAPEDPTLPVVLVQGTEKKHKERLVPHTLARVSITAPGGGSAQLVAGVAEPLRRLLPMPYMGCGLNSGAPSWDCFAGFWRKRVVLGGDARYSATIDVIADALGLERVFAADRRDEIAAMPPPGLDRIVRSNTDKSLAVLDAVIANPAQRITVHDLPGLAERPELLGDRPARMVETIRAGLGNGSGKGRGNYETARVLQGILAALPAADFDAIGPGLLAVLNAQANLNDDTVEQTLATRLGRFGVAALPALERMVFSQPKRPFRAAIYGLCRVGAAAEPLAERLVALAPAGERRNKDLETDVYVTLMRMGRGDIVEREKVASDRFTKIRDKLIQRAIAPASPPSVCTDANNWPTFRE